MRLPLFLLFAILTLYCHSFQFSGIPDYAGWKTYGPLIQSPNDSTVTLKGVNWFGF